jgi:cytoskeletal protein RodZ
LGLDGEEISHKFPQGKLLDIYPSPWWKFPLLQLRPVHLYIVYVAMVIGAVSGLSHLVQRSALQQVTQIETPSPLQQLPSPNPSVEVSLPVNQASKSVDSPSTLISSQPNSDSTKPVVVGIYLQEESWLKVRVDGKTEFEGILPKGEKRSWKANEEITVRAGNAGAVLVAFNNNEQKRLGARGQVMQATYSSKLNQ